MMTIEVQTTVTDFALAAERAVEAGLDAIENRVRFLLEVVDAVWSMTRGGRRPAARSRA
ncbi:hypothetical protein [Actinomadura sp. CNU-125]|uniref:hypothetical protein n=1 Tax=Actinomadura sp. CNU-125 TaxID=1904961 RepID=UPI0021CC7A8C|nr:hypothetical protein [Actinomadura sp. CNU-125]